MLDFGDRRYYYDSWSCKEIYRTWDEFDAWYLIYIMIDREGDTDVITKEVVNPKYLIGKGEGFCPRAVAGVWYQVVLGGVKSFNAIEIDLKYLKLHARSTWSLELLSKLNTDFTAGRDAV
jgi:hypothetical protein